MNTVKLGSSEVSRFILGGNPISGNSHQCSEVDVRMSNYFAAEQAKRLFRDAEALGVRTMLARADRHIIRLLVEHWNDGGKMEWIAQTCPEYDTIERSILHAKWNKAVACYIHGGVMDYLLAQGKLDAIPTAIEQIRAAGMAAGVAGHVPEVFEWAEKNLDVDFYMCSYYNPSRRDTNPERPVSGEVYSAHDRQRMVDTIATLSRPAIHYKVLAAGRHTPEEGFEFAARHLRPGDAVCVGIYDEDHPNMLREDVECFKRSLARASREGASSRR